MLGSRRWGKTPHEASCATSAGASVLGVDGNAVALQTTVERLSVHAQYFCRLSLVSTQRGQHGEDVAPFDLLERQEVGRGDVEPRLGELVVANSGREVIDGDAVMRGQRDRAFHAVL